MLESNTIFLHEYSFGRKYEEKNKNIKYAKVTSCKLINGYIFIDLYLNT